MHEYTYNISATLHKHTLLSEDFTPFVVVSLTCKKECQNFHSKYGVLMDSTLLPTNWSELYTKFLTVHQLLQYLHITCKKWTTKHSEYAFNPPQYPVPMGNPVNPQIISAHHIFVKMNGSGLVHIHCNYVGGNIKI